MLEHLAAGVSAAEAARLTRRELEEQAPSPREVDLLPRQRVPAEVADGDQLRRTLDDLDDAAANAALELGEHGPLVLAGGGIDERDVLPTGARFLADDPFTAAAAIASDLVASQT